MKSLCKQLCSERVCVVHKDYLKAIDDLLEDAQTFLFGETAALLFLDVILEVSAVAVLENYAQQSFLVLLEEVYHADDVQILAALEDLHFVAHEIV